MEKTSYPLDMAALGIAPMEVVFSFDTTGSMSYVLDEVKGRVSDIVQRLQADIPGFRVGIIAHGDYCDQEHFYTIKTLDLTNSLPDVVTFVNETQGTGGGDVPECYELALRHACNFKWSPLSHRVLVVIGDAYPHESDYPLNTDKIDWHNELENLKDKNVKIYAVQVHNDEICTEFFQTLTENTGGQHVKLPNMQRICEAIMGVCYREKGPEFFENYEAEVRLKEPEKVGTDLENLFGTLRREESRQSDATALLDDDDGDDDDVNGDIVSVGKKVRKDISVSSVTTLRLSRKRKPALLPGPDETDEHIRNIKTDSANRAKVGPRPNLMAKRRLVKLPVMGSSKRAVPTTVDRGSRQMREWVPPAKFKYNHLSWCPWKLAVCSPNTKNETPGEWKTVPQCGSDKVVWRKDLLDFCPVKSSQSDRSSVVFEISIMTPSVCRRRTVYCHESQAGRGYRPAGVFGLPWYRGIFQSVRQELNKAACDNCRIYIRWAKLTPKNKNIIKELRSNYDYAWCHRRNSTGRAIY